MARRATLHLISGLPCAGKTTYAQRLTEQRDAVLLTLDRWLITSFGRYSLVEVGYVEHARRVYALRELIWSVAAELLRRGTDVVLDDGFFLRNDRSDHAARARQVGAGAAIHFIDTSADTLRVRLAARMQQPGEYNFDITEAALDACAAIFETPSDAEGADLVVVRDTAGG